MMKSVGLILLAGLLGSAFLLVALEDMITQAVPYAGYLAVISMGMYVLAKQPVLAQDLAGKLSKLWVGAELFCSCWSARRQIPGTRFRPDCRWRRTAFYAVCGRQVHKG